MNNKKKCFVIMPFSETDSTAEKKWTEIFEHTIKLAVEECGLGYECKRYGLGRANIIKDILEDLNRAQVVIADLTDSNSNVLWELGVRHTLSRRTILIAQDKKFLLSDLKDYPLITYKYKQTPAEVSKFKREIKGKLEDIEANPEKPDSPVADFLENKNIHLLYFQKSENYKRLTALVSQLSYNLKTIDSIVKKARQNKKAREKDEEYLSGLDVQLDISGLDLLLSTLYISLYEDLLTEVIEARDIFISTNAKVSCWHELRRAPDIDDKFIEFLPMFKKSTISLLKKMNKLRLDYENNNYQEPKEPIISLASNKHEKYLKVTK